jgi:uncharacterized membrane protein YqhA
MNDKTTQRAPPSSSEGLYSENAPKVSARLHFFRRILGLSRFLIGIAVVCSLLNATILLLYGTVKAYRLIVQVVFGGAEAHTSAKQIMLASIEVTDVFLLATVLYIISIGLYELFIDNAIRLPPWLMITDVDDLKHKLISVVIAILGVTFLGRVISWDGETNLQPFGIAVAIVVAALTYFLSSKREKHK